MPPETLETIADEAYVYGYPLVLMHFTEQQSTNVKVPSGFAAPTNQIVSVEALPDASFRMAVRPNRDTLYSLAWFDLADEPIVIHAPDMADRYYMLPLLDAYTNVFASPGTRTTGSGAKDFALVGPGWQGDLPAGVERIDAPTNVVWMIGRTQINGAADLPAVSALVRQITLTPLSAFGRACAPPASKVDPSIDMKTPPPKIVASLDDFDFFELLAELMAKNPPPPRDAPALERFAKLGLAPGHYVPSPEAQRAIEGAAKRVATNIETHFGELGIVEHGWRFDTNLGSYGTRYLDRATIALTGIGANLAEDAVYPVALADDDGRPFTGKTSYVLRFEKGKEPPVNAFWSLTLYDEDGYFVANPIDRYVIGDRDPLVRNADGSIEILIQRQRPAGAMSANWLPAPDGKFNLLLRTYWPKPELLNGTWKPPAVEEQRMRSAQPQPQRAR